MALRVSIILERIASWRVCAKISIRRSCVHAGAIDFGSSKGGHFGFAPIEGKGQSRWANRRLPLLAP